ncbi:hypothetical protein [Falsiroseomonas selenitidurans]|uniref:Transposase n=1 Tax=Falsiroseomonas selenitidurans TaxID=2716335 RepID=A0ABX1E342_9PROT|nr:hypothetical protein [Falsiroseomonas selenitidurans]NKC31595.1 hypothetical protein [Falsiroseomonas selenitidurans]
MIGYTENLSSETAKAFSQLCTRRSGLSKSDILAYVSNPGGHWNASINDLLAHRFFERHNERRAVRHRRVESD